MGPELGLLLKQTECEAGNQFGIFKFPSPGVLSVLGTEGGGGHWGSRGEDCNVLHYTLHHINR